MTAAMEPVFEEAKLQEVRQLKGRIHEATSFQEREQLLEEFTTVIVDMALKAYEERTKRAYTEQVAAILIEDREAAQRRKPWWRFW